MARVWYSGKILGLETGNGSSDDVGGLVSGRGCWGISELYFCISSSVRIPLAYYPILHYTHVKRLQHSVVGRTVCSVVQHFGMNR